MTWTAPKLLFHDIVGDGPRRIYMEDISKYEYDTRKSQAMVLELERCDDRKFGSGKLVSIYVYQEQRNTFPELSDQRANLKLP